MGALNYHLKVELPRKGSLCFPMFKDNLKSSEENTAVFFSPMMGCQVAGLKVYVAKNDTELLTLQCLLSRSLDFKLSPTSLFSVVWSTEHRASSILGKYVANDLHF